MRIEPIRQMSHIYERFEDEESRFIYRKRLEWLITHDHSYFGEIVEKYGKGERCFPYRSVEEIQEISSGRPLILYGAGGDAEFYEEFWRKLPADRVLGFCDKDEEKQSKGYVGLPVMSLRELKGYPDAAVIVMASSREEEITEELHDIGIPGDRIIGHVFPRLTGLQGMYFDTDIIHFEDEEVFVDGGSYDLSTTLSLSKIANLKKSYAFEADPDNVPKCNEMKERYGLKQAEIFPYGLWSSADMLTFGSTGDTNAGFYQEGKGVSIEVRALDDMINPDECVTFIKMDIEGSELEALKGSRRIIQMWRPKLAICIYHKPENMYELPMYIKELVPEYRLYLRHYSNRAHETVLYAVL